MRISYKPRGVCSRLINLDVEGDLLKDLEIIGGCPGNAQGICKLAKGRPVKEVIGLLDGIRCGAKRTSCPDQLAQALKQVEQQKRSNSSFE